jgi:hypothetical protein
MQPTPYLRFNVAYAQDPRLERFLDRAANRPMASSAAQ